MNTRVELRRGSSTDDSVVLMQVSQAVAACHGVAAAIVAMATPLNIEIYERLGRRSCRGEGSLPKRSSRRRPWRRRRARRGGSRTGAAACRHLRRRRATGSDHPPAPRTLRIRASPGRFPGTDLGAGSTTPLWRRMDASPGGSLGDAVLRQRSCVTEEITLKDEAARHRRARHGTRLWNCRGGWARPWVRQRAPSRPGRHSGPRRGPGRSRSHACSTRTRRPSRPCSG